MASIVLLQERCLLEEPSVLVHTSRPISGLGLLHPTNPIFLLGTVFILLYTSEMLGLHVSTRKIRTRVEPKPCFSADPHAGTVTSAHAALM